MPRFCVNENPQPPPEEWEHEVHNLSEGKCSKLPNEGNRRDLGFHTDCRGAVKKAKESFSKVDGCKLCCPACHNI